MFTALVAVNTRGRRIELGLAVHEKPILVVTVAQKDLNMPPTIHPAAHGHGDPMIEIAGDLNGLRAGSRLIRRMEL